MLANLSVDLSDGARPSACSLDVESVMIRPARRPGALTEIPVIG